MDLSIKEIPIHFIDFEGSRASGIVEYGVVTVLAGAVVECHTRLCAPQGVISAQDQRLHGITSAEALGMRPFSDEWSFFKQLRAEGVLAAHHAAVENGLLKQVWPYPGNVPDFSKVPPGTTQEWAPWIDTRRLYEQLYPDLPDYKLSHLISLFQLDASLASLVEKHCPSERSRYHCALYDALASAVLLMAVLELPGYEKVCLDWLIAHSESHKRLDAQSQRKLEL